MDMCRWSGRNKHKADSSEHSDTETCNSCSDSSAADKKSVVILIPVRLGEASLNPIYTPCLQAMLTLDHCMGIIGGKPKHSMYFVGFQGKVYIIISLSSEQTLATLEVLQSHLTNNYVDSRLE